MRKDIPHRVARKTNKKIVFEHLIKGLDGKIKISQQAFKLRTCFGGAEYSFSNEKGSMIPTMIPDKPYEKPSIWDSIANDETKAKAN